MSKITQIDGKIISRLKREYDLENDTSEAFNLGNRRRRVVVIGIPAIEKEDYNFDGTGTKYTVEYSILNDGKYIEDKIEVESGIEIEKDIKLLDSI